MALHNYRKAQDDVKDGDFLPEQHLVRRGVIVLLY